MLRILCLCPRVSTGLSGHLHLHYTSRAGIPGLFKEFWPTSAACCEIFKKSHAIFAVAPCDRIATHATIQILPGGLTGCRKYCRNKGTDGQVVKAKGGFRGSFSEGADHKRQFASLWGQISDALSEYFSEYYPTNCRKSSRWQLRYGLHISDRGLFTLNLYLGLQLEIYR